MKNILFMNFLIVLAGVVILVNCSSSLPAQFSGVTGGLQLFRNISSSSSRYQKARAVLHTASDECLNVMLGLTSSGIQVIKWPCQWDYESTPVNQLFYAVEAAGYYLLKGSGKNSNICLFTETNENDRLFTTPCKTGDSKQQFEFRRVVNEQFQIVQLASGRCLKATTEYFDFSIRTVKCNKNDLKQRWQICNGAGKCM